MHMHRPIRPIGEQAQLLEYIETIDYTSDPVQVVPPDQARAIVDSLGWPHEPGLHILACRLNPGEFSAIHEDRSSDGAHLIRWSFNIPIKDCWGTWMEWFVPISMDPEHFYEIGNPGDMAPVPALHKANARLFARSKGCETAYVARSDQWHRVVNLTDRVSWCVSVRYYPLSSERWDLVSQQVPWLDAIQKTGRP
jgi:hypothetical protein